MAYIAMKPRFSIIVPLYNKAPYVKKALDSIVSQSFKDWECIIVDDGSIDGSVAICDDFINSLTPSFINSLRLIRQPNSGVAKARNVGVENSSAPFVCFLDADDWWEPTFLEEMDKLISEYPDACIYATNYIYYKPGKTHVALKLERGYMNYPEAYLHGEMPVWTGATCMPRRVLDEMGGFPVGIKLGEDFLLWAKTALHYPVAYSEKPLAYYNNDVPAHLRATRNLHSPKYHKIFNLDVIENELRAQSRESRGKSGESREVWKALLDKHRVEELLPYWLSDEYHDIAAEELKKVDWDKQPGKVVTQYKQPIWLLRANIQIKQIGSYVKQKLIRMIKL